MEEPAADARTAKSPMTRAGFLALVEQLRALLQDASAERAALVEALGEQLPVMVIRALDGHNGFKYVEAGRRWVLENGAERELRTVSVSTNSSCECREMSSDPDWNEMDEHQSKLEHKARSFLGHVPAFVTIELFGRAEQVRFYKWPTVRYAIAPFAPED